MKLLLFILFYPLLVCGQQQSAGEKKATCEDVFALEKGDSEKITALKKRAIQDCRAGKLKEQIQKQRKEDKTKIKKTPFLKNVEKELKIEEHSRDRMVKAIRNAHLGPPGFDTSGAWVNPDFTGTFTPGFSRGTIQITVTNEHSGPIDIVFSSRAVVTNLCVGCMVTLQRSLRTFSEEYDTFLFTARGRFPDGVLGEVKSSTYSLAWDSFTKLQRVDWSVKLGRIDLSK